MSSNEVLTSDEVVQSALEDLCVAQYAQNYCSFCASGGGCCVVTCDEKSHSDTDNEGEKLKSLREMDEERDQNTNREVRRKTLTIDLSNEENLTDGEILKRLLSPLESPLSDEPLEVILEIVGEEEDEDNENEFPSEKTFQSLRDKLRKISSKKPSRESRQNSLYWKRQLKKIKSDLAYSNKYPDDDNFNPDYSSVEQCPSFHKANNLINEIEKCFVETAELVEKTLEASKCQVLLETQNSNRIFEDSEGKDTRNFTSTVNEALTIFDSLLNDNKHHKKHKDEHSESPINTSNYSTLSNGYKNYDNNSYKNNYNYNYNYYNPENLEEQPTYQYEGTVNETKKRESFLFDKDIEDLFRECYEASSVEPSTSLEARIRNLESLCCQLNKVKENILNEMKFEFPYNLNKENYDCYSSRSSSLDSQECYSVINDLIDKRLKEKLRKNKFNLGPPLMGLEGKTHKKIAEALHLNYYIENGRKRDIKEKRSNRNYQGNKYKISNASSTISSLDEQVDQQETNSESTSEMSITNYTLDSGHYSSLSSNNASDYYRNYTINKDSLFPNENDQSSAMSYEETLALYEDNQELQKSLLSILHSLNDIHDNFLHRRRMEMALSQQNSTFIQNHLKSEIYSGNQSQSGTKLNNFYSSYSTPINELTDHKLPLNNMRETDDFEPIEKIIRVSDELKNLWLYSPKDLHLKTRKPLRSVSFNKGTKRYKQFTDYYEESISDDYDVTEYVNSNKSLSLPNLSLTQTENYDTNSESSSLSSPSSTPVEEQKQHYQQDYQLKDYNVNESKNFFVDSFVKKVRGENNNNNNSNNNNSNNNNNNYETTLDFLRKLMNTSKLEFDDDSLNTNGKFTKQAENSQNYNAFLRTY